LLGNIPLCIFVYSLSADDIYFASTFDFYD
jgi:hypothetical protein